MAEEQTSQNLHTTDQREMLTILDVLGQDSVPTNLDRPRGAIKRLFSGDGGNVITSTFAPGQSWPDHRAAHPILVQCLAGQLEFSVGEQHVQLNPGVVVHLNEQIVHRVDCPDNAPDTNVLLLTMLTGSARISSEPHIIC